MPDLCRWKFGDGRKNLFRNRCSRIWPRPKSLGVTRTANVPITRPRSHYAKLLRSFRCSLRTQQAERNFSEIAFALLNGKCCHLNLPDLSVRPTLRASICSSLSG